MHGSTRKASRKRVAAAILGLVALTAITAVLPSSAANNSASSSTYQGVWQLKSDSAFENANGTTGIGASDLQAFSVNKENLEAALAAAPAPDSDDELVISLPDPNGDFQRFAIRQSQIMAPGLAAKHPDIGTFRGRGLDDETATIHADILADRLPRLGPFVPGRLVHRSVLDREPERVCELLRPQHAEGHEPVRRARRRVG